MLCALLHVADALANTPGLGAGQRSGHGRMSCAHLYGDGRLRQVRDNQLVARGLDGSHALRRAIPHLDVLGWSRRQGGRGQRQQMGQPPHGQLKAWGGAYNDQDRWTGAVRCEAACRTACCSGGAECLGPWAGQGPGNVQAALYVPHAPFPFCGRLTSHLSAPAAVRCDTLNLLSLQGVRPTAAQQ